MTRQRNNTLPGSVESDSTIPQQQKTVRQQRKTTGSLDRLLLRLFFVLLELSLRDLMLSSSSSPVDYTYQLPTTAAPTQAPKKTSQPSPASRKPPTMEPTAAGTASGTTSGTQVENPKEAPKRHKKRKRPSGPLERTNDEKTSNKEGD
mmetsp:Transcript_20034/g.49859  ORF Transcript_20034/g.49859 Transcript_20034/m.49859 type:complete len:148 (+) Transcript_20034:177-620(+)